MKTGMVKLREKGGFMRIETTRLILRKFTETDYDDLYEFLSQLRDNEFEGYPGITYENGREHLKYRLDSDEFYDFRIIYHCMPT